MLMNDEFIQRVAIPDFSANIFFFLNGQLSLYVICWTLSRFESSSRDEFDYFQRRFKVLKLVFMHLKPMHQRQLQ